MILEYDTSVFINPVNFLDLQSGAPSALKPIYH